MSNRDYWLKSGIINIFQNIISVLIGFFSFYILVRVLSKEEYGTWVLFLSVVNIVELARNGLTQEAFVKYLSVANRVDQRKITTATFIINLFITVFAVLILLIISPFLAKSWHSIEINYMLKLYSIVFFLSAVLSQLNCIEKANLKFTGIFYSNTARQLVIFGYVFICFIFSTNTNVIILTYIQIISIIIATVIAFFFTYKKIRFTYKIDLLWIKKIFNFGKYTFGVSLTSVLANSIDQMMLGSLLSKTASGVFNIAVRITNLADIPTTAIATIVFPQSSIKITKEGDSAAKYLYEKSVGVVLSILIPIVTFIYVFANYIIPLIAGQKYIDSIPLLKITLIAAIFSPYNMQAGTILTSAGRTKINFYLVILSATNIIVLNYILINKYGIIGAAYSALIAAFINFTISQVYLNKLYKVKFINAWIYAYKFYPELYYKYIKKNKD